MQRFFSFDKRVPDSNSSKWIVYLQNNDTNILKCTLLLYWIVSRTTVADPLLDLSLISVMDVYMVPSESLPVLAGGRFSASWEIGAGGGMTATCGVGAGGAATWAGVAKVLVLEEVLGVAGTPWEVLNMEVFLLYERKQGKYKCNQSITRLYSSNPLTQ